MARALSIATPLLAALLFEVVVRVLSFIFINHAPAKVGEKERLRIARGRPTRSISILFAFWACFYFALPFILINRAPACKAW
jgi:hypothetical protein